MNLYSLLQTLLFSLVPRLPLCYWTLREERQELKAISCWKRCPWGSSWFDLRIQCFQIILWNDGGWLCGWIRSEPIRDNCNSWSFITLLWISSSLQKDECLYLERILRERYDDRSRVVALVMI